MNWTRRKFICAAIGGVPALGLGYSWLVESEWLEVKKVLLTNDTPSLRLVHFSDLHYKGGASYAEKIITRINDISADCVVFSGDLVEGRDRTYLDKALDHITQIRHPVFGVPGNHDPQDLESVRKFKKAFAKTGGAWFRNEAASLGDWEFWGSSGISIPNRFQNASREKKKRVLITHYPATCRRKTRHNFDLILAGHSHGGQIRMPWLGAIYVPYGVEGYIRGLYETALGKLYVNVGVGTLLLPLRFLCRPEIAVIHL